MPKLFLLYIRLSTVINSEQREIGWCGFCSSKFKIIKPVSYKDKIFYQPRSGMVIRNVELGMRGPFGPVGLPQVLPASRPYYSKIFSTFQKIFEIFRNYQNFHKCSQFFKLFKLFKKFQKFQKKSKKFKNFKLFIDKVE